MAAQPEGGSGKAVVGGGASRPGQTGVPEGPRAGGVHVPEKIQAGERGLHLRGQELAAELVAGIGLFFEENHLVSAARQLKGRAAAGQAAADHDCVVGHRPEKKAGREGRVRGNAVPYRSGKTFATSYFCLRLYTVQEI